MMEISSLPSRLTFTERACDFFDYIPIISTIANLVHLILLRAWGELDPMRSDYGKFQQLRSVSGLWLRAIPLINIIVSACLSYQRTKAGLDGFTRAGNREIALASLRTAPIEKWRFAFFANRLQTADDVIAEAAQIWSPLPIDTQVRVDPASPHSSTDTEERVDPARPSESTETGIERIQRDNAKQLIQGLKSGAIKYKDLPRDFQANREFLLELIQEIPWLFNNVSQRNDLDFAWQALRANVRVFGYFPESFQSNPAMREYVRHELIKIAALPPQERKERLNTFLVHFSLIFPLLPEEVQKDPYFVFHHFLLNRQRILRSDAHAIRSAQESWKEVKKWTQRDIDRALGEINQEGLELMASRGGAPWEEINLEGIKDVIHAFGIDQGSAARG